MRKPKLTPLSAEKVRQAIEVYKSRGDGKRYFTFYCRRGWLRLVDIYTGEVLMNAHTFNSRSELFRRAAEMLAAEEAGKKGEDNGQR